MLDPAMTGQYDYRREELDHYPTPRECTVALMHYLGFGPYHRPRVWEPACGTGAISKVIEEHGCEVYSTDIKDYGYGVGDKDFLSYDESRPYGHKLVDTIITNPPYGDIAEQFVRHAIKLIKPTHGMTAMLMRNEWDCAKSRRDLFNVRPFSAKLVLTWRPRWVADSTGSPRHNYAWYIWNFESAGDPIIKHITRPEC